MEVYYEGQRLSYGRSLCTVRYFGEVHETKGNWIGIEWDDPTKGKHAGDHKGVKYFKCLTNHPTAGSFIRPTRPSDIPNGFVEALRLKYASELESGPDDLGVPSNTKSDVIRISGKDVEEVGFDKIRTEMANLQALRVVILDTLCISRPQARGTDLSIRVERSEQGYSHDVQDTSPNIVELDLSCNLFEEWNEIVDICKQLQDLRSLKLNGNRFRSLSNALFDQAMPFASLRSLGLDNTLLSWEQVMSLASTCPTLISLSVAGNEYSNLTACPELPLLETLNLEGNNLTSLHGISPIGKLKKLHTLNLKNNAITTISSGTMTPLKELRNVDLAFNAVESWEFVDMLSTILPNLEVLRLSHNPLYEGSLKDNEKQVAADLSYMLTVARVGTLTQLNYSEITLNERLNAETFYLSRIAAELSSSAESEAPRILRRHSRWNELCEKYSEPIIQRKLSSAIDPNSLEARLIKCLFTLDENVETIGRRTVTCEIPKSLTIYSVLSLVGKKFNLQPLLLRLVWRTSGMDDVEQEHSNDSRRTWNEKQAESAQSELLMGEVLVPRTRHIGTWIEGTTAMITVEQSEDDIQRQGKTHSLCSSLLKNGYGI